MILDRWSLRRFRHANLKPVLLWDARLPEGEDSAPTVYERLSRYRVETMRREGREDPDIAATLVKELIEVLEHLHRGGVEAARGFDRVFIEGRLLELNGFRAALNDRTSDLNITLAPPRTACVELGAEQIRRQLGRRSQGMLVDIGHSAVNTFIQGDVPCRRSLERNFERLPLARGSVPPPSKSDRTPFVDRSAEFIARAVVTALLDASQLDPVIILALPCELDTEGTPGPCTYPGWEGNPNVALSIVQSIDTQLAKHSEALQWSREEFIDVWTISHVELVALSAEAILGPPGPAGTLAVTLGFGPSSAVLRGDS